MNAANDSSDVVAQLRATHARSERGGNDVEGDDSEESENTRLKLLVIQIWT